MYTLKLLGGASLEGPDGMLAGAAAQRQRLALLALLALSPNCRVSRDKALALLWPESDRERARHALSNAIYGLKKELGEDSVSTPGDDLSLNPSVVTVDVLLFEAAIRDGSVTEAASLFTGRFMDGVHLRNSPEFERWVDGQRDRLDHEYVGVLESLARQATNGGDNDAAVSWWRRLAAVDPHNSKVALELMRALDAAGNRPAAIQHARIYAALVTEDLGIEPDSDVADLADLFRSGAGPNDPASREEPPAGSVPHTKGATRSPDQLTADDSWKTAAGSSVEAAWGTNDQTTADSSTEEHDEIIAPTSSTPIGSRRSTVNWVAGIGIAVLTAVLVIWLGKNDPVSDQGSVTPTLVRDRPSIAVLPFTAINPDSDDAYLADGMHEEILTRISKVADLIVISRTSVLRYRNHIQTAPEIAAELGVSALLEGSVQRAGDSVRITAQLINGETDEHIWAESFNREFTVNNLFEIQSEIAFLIADSLRVSLSAPERARITRPGTSQLTAYELYLRGRQAASRYRAEQNEIAIHLYEEAIALDSGFAQAWAGLAGAYGQGVLLFGFSPDWIDSAMATSRRSIAFDPDRAEGYQSLGLAYTARGTYRPALAEYSRALEIDPNHASAIANVGVIHMRFGALDSALFWMQRAMARSPTYPLISANIAWSYLSLGEWDLAVRWARHAVALDTQLAHAHQALSVAAIARNDCSTALDLAQQIVESDPNAPVRRQFAAEIALICRDYEAATSYSEQALGMTLGGSIPPWHYPGTTLGFLLHESGETDRANELLRQTATAIRNLMDAGSDDPRLAWELGTIFAIQGEVESALEWLERGYERGWRWQSILEWDPILDGLRDNPRFGAIVDAMAEDVGTMKRRAEFADTFAGLR